MSTTMLRPVYQVTIGGQDMTARLKPRLQSLTITTCRADQADQLDLSFTDTDGRLALPRTGVELAVKIGFANTGVSLQGTFTVDEVEHAGAPDIITVRGRSAPVSGALRTRKERSWDGVTLETIIGDIAGEHGLTPKVSATLAGVVVGHIDQTESDMAFLRRIGKRWDAVSTVKAGRLLFAPCGKAQSAGGTDLPAVTLTRRAGDRHRYHAADRDAYTGVRAHWHDVDSAKAKGTLAGKSGHVKVLRGTYASREDANDAAAAEMARVARGAVTFELTCAVGRPDLFPEMPVQLDGWGDTIGAVPWIITRAVHQLDGDGGYTTALEMENKATAAANPAKDDGAGIAEDEA